jgi:large subunit ribosomal protein L9
MSMQVLLINNVERVGLKGQTIKVAEGYARNFLFPRNLAVPLTEGTQKHLQLVKQSWERQEVKEREAAHTLAKQIEGLTIKITKKAGDKGRLFGSVTNSDIAELLHKEAKVTIDKKLIVTDHLKEIGEHDVVVKIIGDVKATLKVVILPEEAAAQA